ncbi:MAG TPA: hypothetical protein VHO03_05530 [Ignavibacteriales bacterium]|nr:hypothetical protein [Ignavibacteriales bacterium]
MSIELILIIAFVIVTFIALQIVKIRKPEPVQSRERTIVSPEDCRLVEVHELDENQ